MARLIRVEFEGAVYHAMARGNERRTIFRSDSDRELFLQTLAETGSQFGLLVHVYCLMPNHYHLVVETPRGNLSRALGWLQVTYTVRFNRRHRRSGHLFQRAVQGAVGRCRVVRPSTGALRAPQPRKRRTKNSAGPSGRERGGCKRR